MAAPPQQQTTPSDHHYFEWATTKQQKLVEQSLKVVPIAVNQQQISANNTNTNNTTNMVHNHPHLHNHPLMTHTHRRHYYQHFEEKRSLEDSKQKQNKTTSGMVSSTMANSPSLSPSSTNCTSSGHVRKRQKTNTNGINSTSSTSSLNTSDDHTQSQTCYPFQAELTQKIDIECGGGGSNGSGQKAHTPTHHFTLSTVINVSVNGQTSQQQKPLDILPSPSSSSLSQQQCPLPSNDQQEFLVHPCSSSSPSVLSTSSPSTASPSTTINSTNLNNSSTTINNNNNNNSSNSSNNPISNLITSTSPSTNLLSQSPSILPSSSSSISFIPFSELNFLSYIKDLDLTTFDSFALPTCPNSQDYLTFDGLITFLNSLNTACLVSDNNNNNLSIQKTIEYNKRYQQQMISRSDSLSLRQTPYLPNATQQYSDTYRMQQQQQVYNYSTRPTHFEQPNRYYPNRYPSMISPYSSYPSYSYPSHNQQYQMSQHYNYASPTNSSVNVSSIPQQNSSSMIMTGTCTSTPSMIPSMNLTQSSHPSSSNYGSVPSSSSYDPLSSHITHSPSNPTTGTGNVYSPSYYRQSSVPSYPTSIPQQQQSQQQQLTRQISSNFPMTSVNPSNPTTSNVNSSSSSPVPPFR
ncbi:unnamed protein product [Rotaria magnacalcarata]|uniref:Uncharacterized protein n=2 Tax=Rotaria magnacalcarata TaxID=392030 RepID=A0A818WPX2_9BILA|nr:unnamed protein product [Rotaria magnacalcarata]CAF2099904.1 unnamed protein product [Rotaria magnacalcarata]CAF3728725.1 unnamed protein product [Rotaria magnacalcarata]CAF3897229.1 unnamed protein product [Rotaria magnacalcarata]